MAQNSHENPMFAHKINLYAPTLPLVGPRAISPMHAAHMRHGQVNKFQQEPLFIF